MMTFILAAFFLVLSAVPSWATTRYVSGGGHGDTPSDTNTCAQSQTITTPKLTFASAVACLAAGDTLYIRGGVWTQRIDLQTPGKTGISGSPITIAGYPGETAIIRYTDTVASGYGALKTRTSAYMIYDNLDIDGVNFPAKGCTGPNGSCQIGISIFPNMHHSTFNNLRVYNQHFVAFYIEGGHHITISNSEMRDAQSDCLAGDRYMGVYQHNGDSNTFSGNHIHDMPGGGMQVYGESGTNSNHVITRNLIHDSSTCSTQNVGGITVSQYQSDFITNVQIYNNIIYNIGLTARDSIVLPTPGIEVSKGATGTKIWNNTIYHNGGEGIRVLDPSTTGTSVQNNIAYGNNVNFNRTDVYISGASVTSDHNLTTNPTFVNSGSGDFSLATGSAAINAGTNVGLPFNGANPEIGAFETFGFSNASINQASLDVTLAMNANVPVGGTYTGFTVACSGAGCGTPVVQSAAKLTSSDSVIRLNLTGITTGVCAAGQTWTVSYAPGGVTDSALIGNVRNQSLFAFTTQAVTNGCAAGAPPPPPAVTGISYLFDDGSGTSATDATGGGSTGTLTGSPLPSWVTGKHGGALSFPDQINSYVAVPYGSGVNPSTQALTVCGGVLPLAGTESLQRIAWSTDNGTNQRFYLGWYNGTWSMGIQSSSFQTSNPEFPVSAGWAHVCIKASSGTATLYVNGVKGLSAQSVKSYTSYTLASNFKIGLETTNSINYGASTQDEWKLFTSALTDQNITDLYLNWEPPPPPPAAGVFAQKNHQFFNATTAMAGGTPVSLAAIGASATLVRPNTSFAIVTQTDCTGGACTPLGERLRYSYKPAATGVAGPFLSVPDVCGTDNICFFGSTADPLVLSGTVTCCLSGALTAVDGTTQYTMGATPIVTLAQNSSMVQRRMLIVTNGAASGDIYYFKEYDQNDVSGVGFTAGTPYTPSAGAQLTVQNTTFAAPVSLRQAGAASNTLVDIVWAPVTDSTLAGYHVYESQTSGVYGSPVATITQASANATHSSVTQWRTVHTTAGTYYYIVKPFDLSGNEGAASPELTVILTGMNPRVAR